LNDHRTLNATVSRISAVHGQNAMLSLHPRLLCFHPNVLFSQIVRYLVRRISFLGWDRLFHWPTNSLLQCLIRSFYPSVRNLSLEIIYIIRFVFVWGLIAPFTAFVLDRANSFEDRLPCSCNVVVTDLPCWGDARNSQV